MIILVNPQGFSLWHSTNCTFIIADSLSFVNALMRILTDICYILFSNFWPLQTMLPAEKLSAGIYANPIDNTHMQQYTLSH